jgi:hypothetical protein
MDEPPPVRHRESTASTTAQKGRDMAFGLRDFLATLKGRSRREQYLEQYVLREHARGRTLDEILNDHYVQNRTSEAERARLLDRPKIVAALGRRPVVDEAGRAATR